MLRGTLIDGIRQGVTAATVDASACRNSSDPTACILSMLLPGTDAAAVGATTPRRDFCPDKDRGRLDANDKLVAAHEPRQTTQAPVSQGLSL
jgi:hypothetical protein